MPDINDLPERFWKKVDRSGGHDVCWPWLAATVEGYPIFRNPIDRLVRRYLWFLLHGERSTGFVVSCRFDTVACVNPTHPVKLSISQRTQKAIDKGTFRSPFVDCNLEDRAEYAASAKEVVEALEARHIFTTEQRAKGHETRGCIPGGSGPRFRFDLPREERQILLRDPCVYCNGVSVEIDHIYPFALGGSHEWQNRAPACFSCNRTKNNTELLRFLVRRAMKHGVLTAASGLTYAGH